MSAVQKVVLLPRFTTLSGAQQYRSAPINVRDFATADLTAWRSVGIDLTGCSIAFEESTDLVAWSAVSATWSPSLQANTESTASCTLELPWVRVVVTLVGSEFPMVTCWLVGNFTLRDR